MGDSRDLCPHLDSIGEVTKEDLLLKSKVRVMLTGWAGGTCSWVWLLGLFPGSVQPLGSQDAGLCLAASLPGLQRHPAWPPLGLGVEPGLTQARCLLASQAWSECGEAVSGGTLGVWPLGVRCGCYAEPS